VRPKYKGFTGDYLPTLHKHYIHTRPISRYLTIASKQTWTHSMENLANISEPQDPPNEQEDL